jgi:hypothetical protein
MAVSNGTSRKFELTSDFIEPNESPAVEDATFEKVWVEHDVKVDGKKGMRIHTSFTVKNNLNVVCTLVAHFYKREGAQLEGADLQGDYSTSDGHVVTYVKVTPRFTSTRYSDKTLFIPYREFIQLVHLSSYRVFNAMISTRLPDRRIQFQVHEI